tara:strand:+ start:736 stop:2178 length:1443 start_codon:yes stop_codon:yes gene_type:complete
MPNAHPKLHFYRLFDSFAIMTKHLLFSLLFLAGISLTTEAQNWGRVGTGTNGTVRTLTTFSDGIAIGGDFTIISMFDRIGHSFIRENKFDEYTVFKPYSDQLNVSSSSAATLTPIVHTNTKFDGRLHIGGRFNHPDYEDNVGLGYFQLDPQTNTTSFLGYDVQLADSQSVYCMLKFDDRLFFGGDFESLGSANFIGSINSEDYPTPTVNNAGSEIDGAVYALEIFEGQLHAGGNFSRSDTDTVYQSNIARWNGLDWDMVGSGLNGPVFSLHTFNDQLIIGGTFTASDSNEMLNIASWDGSDWSAIGTGFTDSVDTVFSLVTYDDTLYAGGRFDSAGSVYVQNIAKLSGTEWTNIGEGIRGPVYAMEEYRGRLYIGGSFTKADELVSRNIVSYNNGNVPFGIESKVQQNTVVIYPNPAKGLITLQTDISLKSAQLISTLGACTQVNILDNTISLESIPSGFYILQTTDQESNTFNQSLIIQ